MLLPAHSNIPDVNVTSKHIHAWLKLFDINKKRPK